MFLLKQIPKVDKLANNKAFEVYSNSLILKIIKRYLEDLRESILNEKIDAIDEEKIIEDIKKEYEAIVTPSLTPLINCTGIIVHTNLGRSLLSENSLENIKQIVTNYNNLEYDLEKGKRGERYSHISKILKELTGCEDALVVNNNASAVFLVLNTFARKKEVVVSRGELVEIGGSFRVPEVMKQSGAKLKEIGTTNKTHKKDYKEAINKKTSILMKVHKSNYSIEGFSSDVSFEDIVEVAQENSLIDYYDMGSGHVFDLPNGLKNKEPSINELMQYKPSLVSFSGDKLLGSVQAGIILGKKELIDKLKKNQLLRMLRVDKLTLALLEENLKSQLLNKANDIPTLYFLNRSLEELEKMANKIKENINENFKVKIEKNSTLIGGGTTPNRKIPTIVLKLSHKTFKAMKLEKILREKKIIVRIENDTVLLDLKAVKENQIEKIINKVNSI